MAKYDIAVIGLGRFGSALALRLEQNGQRVLGVDVDESVVENLKEDIRHLAIAEARDEETLRQLEITPDTLVVLGMTDVAASLMAATARSTGLVKRMRPTGRRQFSRSRWRGGVGGRRRHTPRR